MHKLPIIALACASVAQPTDSSAEIHPEPPALVVTAQRNPQTFSYRKGLRIIERFEAVPAAQRANVRLAFYVVPKGFRNAGALELGLEADEDFLPISISEHGEIDLPVSTAASKNARVVANVPKGALDIVYKIDIVPPSGAPATVGWAKAAIGEATAAWKAVLPAVARLSVPKFNCAEFHLTSPSVISVISNEGPLWSAAGSPETSVRLPLSDLALPNDANVVFEAEVVSRIAACKE